jgi:hypothetical protein
MTGDWAIHRTDHAVDGLHPCMRGRFLMRICHSFVWWYRMATVPLVCVRWHGIMADASMWSVVDLQPLRDRNARHAGSMVAWLQQRGPGMRELTMQASASVAHAQIQTRSNI